MNTRFWAHYGETRSVLIIIIVSLVVRVALAATMGFSFDETYHLVASRQFALSYFDHPPLIMWLIGAVTRLTGSEGHFIVRLPSLLLFTAQNWLLYRLTAVVFGRQAGLYAVLAISLSPLFIVYFGTIAVTDGPLMLSLTGAAWCIAHALFADGRSPWRDWLLAGLFFGFALLSKFSAVLLLPGLAIFILTVPRHRHLFFTLPPYAAAIMALIVFSPVILWNLQHDLVAFAFQTGRAAMGFELHLKRVLVHVGVFLLAFGLLVWPLQIATLFQGLRAGPRDERRWFFTVLALAPLLFFLAMDLFGSIGGTDIRAHWVAPGYLFTFPMVGALVADLRRQFQPLVRWAIRMSVVGFAVLLVGYLSHVLTGWMRYVAPSFNEYDPIVSDQTDWVDFRAALQARNLLDPKRYFVLIGRYEFCFKAQFVLKDIIPVACLTDNPIYNLLAHDNAALLGRDAIIVVNWWQAPQSPPAVATKFQSVEPLAPAWMTLHGRPTMPLELWLGHNLQKPLFEAPPP